MAVEVQPVPGSKVYPRWVGPSLIIGLALVLVVLWYRQRPDGIGDVRFAGELIGVEIVTLLCWALVLMTLLPLVERVFGGLDRMTVWHRRVAVVAVILIPVHLILISTQEDPDASTIGNALGYIALFGLVILILWAILPTLIRLRLKGPALEELKKQIGVDLARWDAKNGTNIPMVVVRAASNYDQIPLRANGQPVLNKQGKPMTAMQDILLGFDDTSSDYASATAAAPVLRMFQLRAAA